MKRLLWLLYSLAILIFKGIQLLATVCIKAFRFLKNWNEFVTVPVALGLFWFIRPIMRYIDPTAGVFDLGIIHVFFAGLVIYLLVIAAVWLIVRLTYKVLYIYLDVQFEVDFKTLSNYQKCVLSLGFFSIVLLGFSITLASL